MFRFKLLVSIALALAVLSGCATTAREAAVRRPRHLIFNNDGDDIWASGADTVITGNWGADLALLVKASAGGGGRGIRRVEDLKALPDALRMARNEAQTAFGDPSVLLERFIEAPRHIEVQILADKHGNVRHLYERDCSIQRNYQKIIEEAPAPNLKPELRARILADAVKLAAAGKAENA